MFFNIEFSVVKEDDSKQYWFGINLFEMTTQILLIIESKISVLAYSELKIKEQSM